MAVVQIPRLITAPDFGLHPWFLRRIIELASAVGRVSVGGRGFGTGFLIRPGLLVTCYHVIPDIATAQESVLELDYQRDEDGTYRRVTTMKLDPTRYFMADPDLDFTAIGLESELRDRVPIPLAQDAQATPASPVTLFHHPLGGPLQVAVLAGRVLSVDEQFVFHDANTQPGSAGGPLLDQDLRLIGVHHAARRQDRADAKHVGSVLVNEAIRATAIGAVLSRHESLHPSPSVEGAKGPSQPTPSAGAATTEFADPRTVVERNSVFISYARADQGKRKWRERLRTFLTPFGQDLDVWDDSRIETGAQWRAEIDIALKRARVAVLLIGPAFLASDFISKNELPPLLAAAKDEGVAILPLITNHSAYERTALGKYQAFNDPKKPLEALDLPDQNRWMQQFAEKVDEVFRKPGK